jgi:hypothetical protein
MNYFEEELKFIEEEKESRSFESTLFNNVPQELGISLRLGNAPIVKDLKKLMDFSGKSLPPDLQVIFEEKNIYIIVHMIGAIRLKGSAKVDELQYNAEIINSTGAQTLDLLPNTTFKELLNINIGFQGSISANGNFSASIPPELIETLASTNVTLGGDMNIQLSTDSNFVGKFTYSLKFPVVQSLGIASTSCTWILNPQNVPLLGDQLLVQTIAVPKGTEKITYLAKGICKADRGLFWKKKEIETAIYTIEVPLSKL